MYVTQIYAIAAGGIFLGFLLFNSLSLVRESLYSITVVTSKYFTYQYVMPRYRFLGPWTPAAVLIHLSYLIINILCLTIRVPSLKEAGERAGTLLIVNLSPLFLGLHLAFVADLLGLSLMNLRRLHRSAGLMSFALVLLRIFIAMVKDPGYSLQVSDNLYSIIGVSALAVLILLSLRFVRKRSYELFLRIHQALAFLSAFALWRSLSPESNLNQVCLYVSLGLFCSIYVLQTLLTLYRNNAFRGRVPRALITRVGSGFELRVMIDGKLKVQEGEYINIWIPSISSWSFLQSHPFIIASYGHDEDNNLTFLDLLVEPQRGFTSKLMWAGSDQTYSRLVLFTGPHGLTAPLGDYGTVLMIASSSGIFAKLPYLQQLVREYNNRTIRTRRIHLVWQLQNIGEITLAQALLNKALKEDAIAKSYILCISIYYASGSMENGLLREGQHRRVSTYKGLANLDSILHAEIASNYSTLRKQTPAENESFPDEETLAGDEHSDTLKCSAKCLKRSYKQTGGEGEQFGDLGDSVNARKSSGKILITVSASDETRDKVRRVVRGHLEHGVKLLELDYQPTR